MIDDNTGSWSSSAEPVQTDPLAYLRVGPWVVVGPGYEFIVYPGKQGNRTIRQGKSDCRWPLLLDLKVAIAISLLIGLSFLQPYSLLWSIPIQEVCSQKSDEGYWRFQRWWRGNDEVQVNGTK